MLRAIRKPKTELQTVPELDPKRDRNLHAGFTVKTGYIRQFPVQHLQKKKNTQNMNPRSYTLRRIPYSCQAARSVPVKANEETAVCSMKVAQMMKY